jgi:hypothetical protein
MINGAINKNGGRFPVFCFSTLKMKKELICQSDERFGEEISGKLLRIYDEFVSQGATHRAAPAKFLPETAKARR